MYAIEQVTDATTRHNLMLQDHGVVRTEHGKNPYLLSATLFDEEADANAAAEYLRGDSGHGLRYRGSTLLQVVRVPAYAADPEDVYVLRRRGADGFLRFAGSGILAGPRKDATRLRGKVGALAAAAHAESLLNTTVHADPA